MPDSVEYTDQDGRVVRLEVALADVVGAEFLLAITEASLRDGHANDEKREEIERDILQKRKHLDTERQKPLQPTITSSYRLKMTYNGALVNDDLSGLGWCEMSHSWGAGSAIPGQNWRYLGVWAPRR